MHHHRWARVTAIATALLAGVGLFFVCLSTVSAAAPRAGRDAPATAQTWFVSLSPGEGLVGYWKFDQVFDSKTFNATPLTFQTILTGGSSITTGMPVTVATASFPDFGALELDGINGAAVVSDNTGLDVSPASFSVAAWVRRVFTGTHTADLIYDSGTQGGHWFFGFLSNDKLTFTTNGLVDYISPFTVTDSNWHHVAAVVNGSGANNLTVYLDGVAAPPLSAVIANTPSGSKLIGNKNGSLNTPFSGDIDELRLYNRALSAAEVGRLAAGRGCVADGTSWATAFDDPQCALQAAASGDQVWLAQGTYHPGTTREASFHLLTDLSVLGGFNGTETSPAQRPAFSPNAPLTALSGDAASDDLPDTFGNYDDNACNVVTTGVNGIPGFAPSVTFDGLAIEDGNASAFCSFPQSSSGGGLSDFSASQLSFNNVVFQANKANAKGGGLAAITNLSLNTVTFSRNQAASGGALTVGSSQGAIGVNTTVTIAGSNFLNNQAGQEGGALQILTGTIPVHLSIASSTFSGNQAHDGGAIAAHSGFSVASSLFSGNQSLSGNGGGLLASGAVTITNSSLVTNTAAGQGGGAAIYGSLVMSGSSAIQNRVNDFGPVGDFAPVGGGVLVSGTAAVTNSQFLSNTALAIGLLSNNLAEGGGLAVQGNLQITGGQFLGNGAEHGGGLYVQGSAVVQGALFQDNTAGSGGGVFADGDLVLVTNRLIHNTALESLTNGLSQGGGVRLQNGGLGDKISNNLFQDNHALPSSIGFPVHGGAVSLEGFLTSLNDNTIVDSGLNGAPAITVTGTTTDLINNIITSHTVGIESLGGQTFIDRDLFGGNTLTSTGAISDLGHNRVADPRFVDPAHGDYNLRINSPAVDAGDNSFVLAPITTDLDGHPRFADVPAVPDTGAGTPPIVDIGAYELASDNVFLPLIRK